MLNAQIKKGTASRIEAAGNLQEIVSDVAIMINAIYFQMKAHNPETADGFKYLIKHTVADPDSPMFQEAACDFTGIMYEQERKSNEGN